MSYSISQASHKLKNVLNEIKDNHLSNETLNTLKEIYELISNEDSGFVEWHIDDFIGRAEEQERTISKEKAREALAHMIRKHDAELGISWITIDCYLDEYEDEEEEDDDED